MFVSDFYKAIDKRKSNLNCLQISSNNSELFICKLETKKISSNLNAFLSEFKPLSFSYNDRYFQLLSFSDWELFEDSYLLFSYLGSERICFNIKELNNADEWDIVSYNNKYVITKTISSYLTNKAWAWIDRGRKVWEDEY
jgi:hypothetical protein